MAIQGIFTFSWRIPVPSVAILRRTTDEATRVYSMLEAVEIAVNLLNRRNLTTPTAAQIKKVAITVVVYQEIKQERTMVGRDLAGMLAALYGVGPE